MNGFCFLLQDCIKYSQSASMEHLCPLLPPDCQNHWSFLSLPPPCLATDLKIAPQITPQTSDPPFNQQCFPQDACIWTLSQPECCNTNHLPPSPSQPPSSVATALKHAWDQDSYTWPLHATMYQTAQPLPPAGQWISLFHKDPCLFGRPSNLDSTQWPTIPGQPWARRLQPTPSSSAPNILWSMSGSHSTDHGQKSWPQTYHEPTYMMHQAMGHTQQQPHACTPQGG